MIVFFYYTLLISTFNFTTNITFVTSINSAATTIIFYNTTFTADSLIIDFFNKSNFLLFHILASIFNSFYYFNRWSTIKKSLSIAFVKAITFLFIVYLLSISSNLYANKKGYKYHTNNIKIELLTIFLESTSTTYRKTFVKTANLIYYNLF